MPSFLVGFFPQQMFLAFLRYEKSLPPDLEGKLIQCLEKDTKIVQCFNEMEAIAFGLCNNKFFLCVVT